MSARTFKLAFPCGIGGLNANTNPYDVPPSQLTEAKNIRFDGNTWVKAPGLEPFEDESTGSICKAGIDWRPSEGVNRQVTCWADGRVLKEVDGDVDAVELASGLDFSEPISLVPSAQVGTVTDRSLYFFSRNVAPKTLVADGVTLAGITNESPDWAANKPAGAFGHDLCTWAFGNTNYPHLIYKSDITDQGDFTGGNSGVFSILPHVGDRISGGISYLETVAIIFKEPYGIVAIDTSKTSLTYLPHQTLREDIGLAGQNLLTKVGSDIMFVSANGRLYSISAIRPDVDPIQIDITEQLNLSKFIDENVDPSKLKYGRLVFDENRQELHYYFIARGDDDIERALIFDISEQGNPKAVEENRGAYFNAVWKRKEDDEYTTLMCGGAGGLIYEMDSPNKSVDGVGYESSFAYPETDLSPFDERLAGVKKRFDWLEIYVVPTGSYDMEFDITVDAERTKTLTFTMSDGDSLYDSAIYDTDVYGGYGFIRLKQRIAMRGNTIQITGRQGAANEEFQILKIVLHLKALGNQYEK